MKKITVLCPKSEFTSEQLQKLEFAGEVSFMDSKSEDSLKDLIKLSKNADILAFSPDKIGKHASEWLFDMLEKSPRVKGLALNTVHANYVNEEYCRERGIKVTTVLDYKTEATAEHTILLLLGCAKRMILNDRRTYRRRYVPELGFELRGKTLGIIGMGSVGERVAELAKAFSMRVFICSETLIRMEKMERRTLDDVICSSDMLTLHLPDTDENKKFLSKEKIARLQEGAIVVNLSGRNLVDERAMAEALKSGRVSQYVFESETMNKSPLEGVETAIMFKPFSGYTHESLKRNKNEWVKNIANLVGRSTS